MASNNPLALGTFLSSFIAFDRISMFVLGRYIVLVQNDQSLRGEWEATFRDYAIANYAIRLERFQGRNHRVTGSLVRAADRDVIVYTEVHGGRDYDPIRLGWRVLRMGAGWTVFDLSVRLDAGEIWLAQQQQAEILSALDHDGGSLVVLIDDVRSVTARISMARRARPS
jgi:ABC-type transporter MlaC component